MSIFVAIIALGFIIFFHELGHFLAAKLCGVGVLEFSIGMGPRIFSRVYKNTRYSLKLLPLGGSCAMLGEDSAGSGDFSTPQGRAVTEEDAEEEAQEEEEDFRPYTVLSGGEDPILDYEGVRFRQSELSERSFQNKPGWQRFLICIAGVFHNFLLAFLLALVVCGFSGFDLPIILGTDEAAPVSEQTIPRGAELQSIRLNQGRTRSIHSFRDLYVYLYLYGDQLTEDTTVTISYRDNEGSTRQASFAPVYDTAAGKYRLGISFFNGRVAAENPIRLLQYASWELQYNVRVVLDSLKLIGRGKVKRNEVMGPVGTVSVISETVQESADYGLFNAALVLMELMVMLSANLGVMNLLPIPALDGGRLLFILLELLLRRRLNPKIEERINHIGMMLLLLLMLLIMTNDAFNMFTGAYQSLH